MEKTIKLNSERSIILSNNVDWLYEFADQFGYDITPTLLPLANTIVESMAAITEPIFEEIRKEERKVRKSKGKIKIQADDAINIMKKLDKEQLKEAIFELFTLRITDFLNVIWAMAKAADEDIAEPRTWIRQTLDPCPFDILIPEAVSFIVEGFVSSKNLQRLQGMKAELKTLEAPWTLTPSPSQESKED